MAESWLRGKKVEEVNYSGGTFDADGRKLTPSGGGGSVATDAIFTAKGDLPVGTGSSTAQALAVGPNDYVLTADSTQTTGLKWAAASSGAPTDATYITQTANGSLSAEQALSSLSTGMVKVTTGTGVLSTGAEGTDYYKPGGTDVAVADGGTGSSTAAGAATNLGLGTGNSPQFTAIEIGHASDTTLARASAGNLTVEGNALYRAGGTDVAVADGGTGASTAATGLINLGGFPLKGQAAGSAGGPLNRWHHISADGAYSSNTLQTYSIALNVLVVGSPYIVPVNMTIDQVGIYVQTGGSAGSTIRIGIWTVDPTNPFDVTLSSQYATLLVDAGTVATTTTGVKTITLGSTQSLTAGQIIVGGAAAQGGGTVVLYTSANNGALDGPYGQTTILNGINNSTEATGISGAFGAYTPVQMGPVNKGGCVFFRRSA